MKRLVEIVMPVIGRRGILRYVLLGLLSGFSSFLFINGVSKIVGIIMEGNLTVIRLEYIVIFMVIILMFVWSRRTLALLSTNISQRIGWRLRKQILAIVLNANYQQLSSRKTKIQSTILADVGALTNASMAIIDFFIALIMVISCLTYLATISWVLFGITVVVAGLGSTVYTLSTRKNMHRFNQARELEDTFQQNLNAILNGFKEIFMEPRKGRFIYHERIVPTANESFRHNILAFTGFINSQSTGQVLFYILITSVLLIFSVLLKIEASDVVSFVFTLIYLLGSIETTMVLFPTLMRAGVAANHLTELKRDLEEAKFSNPIPEEYRLKKTYDNVQVKGLEFYYKGAEDTFGIGPINFTFGKGDVVFIYGGNGSGKTTFIHSVLGLSMPDAGQILVNDTEIDEHNYPDYRSLFAAVFSDFYLFNEILEVEKVSESRFNFYLEMFELEGKVVLEGNRYSTTNLSTGQRKRLALITALMEDKPILVLDEWAADQDPYFRKKFYTEIIPFLKGQGLTILAITHDDKYYHCASKLFKMEEGKLIEENANPVQPVLFAEKANVLP